MTGDQVAIKVSSWYKKNGATPNTPNSIATDLIANLINSLTGAGGPVHGAITSTQLQNTGVIPLSTTNFLNNRSAPDTTKPKAYLNWVLLDEQFKFVQSGSGAEQVGNDQEFKLHTPTSSISKNGYLYVFVSNETPNINVFFDNLQITHLKGPLLEESHYYPFGTEMAALSSHSLPSYVRNRYKANAGAEYGDEEWANNTGLEMYETFYRSYNAQIGRFMQVDPMVEVSGNSYLFSANNPVMFNDPFGDLSQAAWDDVLSRLGNGRNLDGFGEYGGYYNQGGDGGFVPFTSSAEAFGWGAGEMAENGSWGSQPGWASSFNDAYQKFSAGSKTEGEKGYNYINAKFSGAYSNSKYTKDVEFERQSGENFYFAGYGNIFDFNAIIQGYQVQQGTVGQPGAWESAIPIWGSSRAAVDDFQNGNWGWGLFHTAMAVSDVFLIKSIGTGIGKLAVGGVSGIAAKGGGRVFWSGGEEAMNAAARYARSTGGTTLEMTRAGQNLQNLITSRNIPWSEARPMWERLSSVYARGANGTVHFFPGTTVNPGSIWLNVEKPILIDNGVKIITH